MILWSGGPVDPVHPVDLANPAYPVDPIDSIDPYHLVDPVVSVRPIDFADPVDPVDLLVLLAMTTCKYLMLWRYSF